MGGLSYRPDCETLKHLTASPTDAGSHKIFKILKQVQDDKNFGSLCKVQDDMVSPTNVQCVVLPQAVQDDI